MKKILAIIDEVGSNYHRIQLPLSYFNQQEFDIIYRPLNNGPLQEYEVQGIDVLFFNWTIQNSAYQLSLLKKKFGFKIVMDMDDHWDISPTHPSYRMILQYIPLLKDLLILADHITCTTEPLKRKLLEFNNNITVVSNRIPYGDKQFEIESAKKRDKIRFGFIGSISHLPDWYSIKNDIDRIVNDKEIMDNCEFVICGYNDLNDYSKQIWTNIYHLFKGKARVFKTRDIHSYMYLYNEADIVLAPLVNNGQNICKSELKVLETACKGAIVLGSHLYEDKLEKKDLILSDGDKSYYKWIKGIVKNKETLYTVIDNKCKEIMQEHPFQPVITQRENLFKNGL
jgi:hypothetical protein